MPRRDGDAPFPRSHGPRRLALAVVVSLGVHGAALAAIVGFPHGTPPRPLAVVSVTLVIAADLGGGADETALSAGGATAASADPAPATEPERVRTDTLESAPAPPQQATVEAPMPETDRSTGTVSLRFAPPPRKPTPSPPSVSEPAPTTSAPEPPATTAAERKAQDPPPPPSDSGAHAQGERVEASAAPANAETADVLSAFSTAAGPGTGEGPGQGPRYAGAGLGNTAPRYPYAARLRGQQGRVVLRVHVTATGAAESLRGRRSSGYRLLDEAALDAVETWRFVPGTRFGMRVAGVVDVPITFKLED